MTGYSVVAHEIRTEASSNIKINDVDSDGSQEAAITATWNWRATYMGSTGWVLYAWTKLAATTTAIIPVSAGSLGQDLKMGPARFQLTGVTTIFLVDGATFATSQLWAYGSLTCRGQD